jgi:hypothetical protein
MSVADGRDIDLGTGYGRPRPSFVRDLTEVGPGTPMGELLRRYWHPVGLTTDATETPRPLRVLGERSGAVPRSRGAPRPPLRAVCPSGNDALLRQGRRARDPLLLSRLALRRGRPLPGTTLRTRRGPPAGQNATALVCRAGALRTDLRVHGPPHRTPVLPRYDALETLDAGEFIEADANSVGGGGPVVIPCNWLQHYENLMDTYHVPILHGVFSGTQFVEQMALMPQVTWDSTDRGVKAISYRRLPDGRRFRRISEAVIPTLRVIPNPRVDRYGRVETIGWVLPLDDTHFRIYTAGRVRDTGDIARQRSRLDGKLWEALTPDEHRRHPGDYEAQVGQGPITFHSEENLVSSDRGVGMVRRVLRRQLEALAAGQDPIGVSFDTEGPAVRFEAGNFLDDA